MLDIIIAFFAAEGIPVVTMISLVKKSGLPGDVGIIAALNTLGRGSTQAGLLYLVAIHLLAIPIVLVLIRLYYRLLFRNKSETVEDTEETIEIIKTLPVSGYMRQKVLDDVIDQFACNVRARAKARKKRMGKETTQKNVEE